MRVRTWMMALAGLAAPTFAQPATAPLGQIAMPARGDTAPVDYGNPAAWLCRPGVDDGTCSANLDATAYDAAGKATPAPHVAAKDPPIDCFYIYPTVSDDTTLYSDMAPDASERRAVHGQAARLGARCRLYAPVYHQLTSAGLRWGMVQAAGSKAPAIDFEVPYRDVRAAWRSYLARDNRGRGVVIVGHSQGAILLKRLIAEEIDGKPAQKRLVAAYLAGNVDLTSASFHSVPPCRAADQTGCVVAWSSYRAEDMATRFFGGGTPGTPLCVNPAAPAGGRGLLKTYVSTPPGAPAGAPPYVEAVGQLSAECVADGQGAVLRVSVEPGPNARFMDTVLARVGASLPAGWGEHMLDISLVQGNMLDMIGAQAAAWGKR